VFSVQEGLFVLMGGEVLGGGGGGGQLLSAKWKFQEDSFP